MKTGISINVKDVQVMAFDILAINNTDVRKSNCWVRKKLLRDLLTKPEKDSFVDFVEKQGEVHFGSNGTASRMCDGEAAGIDLPCWFKSWLKIKTATGKERGAKRIEDGWRDEARPIKHLP